MNKDVLLFALKGSREFGERVACIFETPLSKHEEREFEDGEHKIRPLINVRNQNVFVILSLNGDQEMSVNDKLCRLLFFIGALRDASAACINVITPYLCYTRKDRRTKARDPLTTRYIAQLFEAAGANRIVTVDVHNLQAFQNAFRIPAEHLEAKKLFVEYFSEKLKEKDIVIMSPDFGGAKRAELFRLCISKGFDKEIPLAIMEKTRSKDIVRGKTITGMVKGKSVIIVDDMISSGGTILRAANACLESGARNVFAVATHGVFSYIANEVLDSDSIEEIIITDTVNTSKLNKDLLEKKIKILSVAPLFAKAIQRIHTGGSITELSGYE
jgi:ribose-phosphate pyrophosphokinase